MKAPHERGTAHLTVWVRELGEGALDPRDLLVVASEPAALLEDLEAFEAHPVSKFA